MSEMSDVSIFAGPANQQFAQVGGLLFSRPIPQRGEAGRWVCEGSLTAEQWKVLDVWAPLWALDEDPIEPPYEDEKAARAALADLEGY